MKGKRFLGVGLLTLALVLAGCGTDPEPTNSSNSSNDTSSNPSDGGTTPPPSDGGSDGNTLPTVEPKITDQYVSPAFAASFEIYDQLKEMEPGVYEKQGLRAFNDDLQDGFNNVAPRYYRDTYTNKLAAPKTEDIANFDELLYAYDYSAFYKITPLIVTFASSYEGTPDGDVYKAWWASRLTPHVVGLSFTKNAGIYTINLEYNDFASTAISKADHYKESITPYLFGNSEELITSIPYTPSKGKLDVQNSDQLLYALYNGYEPVMEENSMVDILYKKASYVLGHIITKSMNDIQKIYAIHNYLIASADYEYVGDDLAGKLFDGELTYPGKVASTFASFYAEGPLLYHWGVCAGYTKAESLLMAMLNIPHKRTTGGDIPTVGSISSSIDSKNETKGYWYHEYNYYVASNGKYYVCDPTYNAVGYFEYENANHEIEYYRMGARNQAVALLRSTWGAIYTNMTDYYYETDSSVYGTEDIHPEQYGYIDATTTFAITDGASLRNVLAKAKTQAQKYKTANNITGTMPFVFQFSISATEAERSKIKEIRTTFDEILAEEEWVDWYGYPHNDGWSDHSAWLYTNVYGLTLVLAL